MADEQAAPRNAVRLEIGGDPAAELLRPADDDGIVGGAGAFLDAELRCASRYQIGLAAAIVAATGLTCGAESFASVFAPGIPSETSPWAAWKALQAAIDLRPQAPSSGPGSKPACFSARWISRMDTRAAPPVG